MIHCIGNFRKLSYSSEEKYIGIHSLDDVIIKQWNTVYSYAVQFIVKWETPTNFPFPNMRVGIKTLIISNVLAQSNPSLSSVLWSVGLDSDLMLWIFILFIVLTKKMKKLL